LPLARIEIARWPDGAAAPVCLMIDDLTDGWIDADGSGRPLAGNDWGFSCAEHGSSFDRLRARILEPFPEVKTTFFVPVDRRADLDPPLHACVFHAADARPAFVEFLGKLAADPRFELAYHGKEHGRAGARAEDYVPEFAGYASVEAALENVARGKEIWRRVLGCDPEGGKYPAYAGGAVGDEAVSRAGFTWWCRSWDRGRHPVAAPGTFEPTFFGDPPVVDVPSTLATPRWPAGIVRRLCRSPRALAAQIAALVAGGDPITVQEHIAWSRPDRRRQRPNVQDDEAELIRVFAALRRYPLWHATCGEIARYFEARSRTEIACTADGFEVRYRGRAAAPPELSLVHDAPGERLVLDGPRGRIALERATTRDGRSVTQHAPLPPGRYTLVR
jgi:hypothetical protein